MFPTVVKQKATYVLVFRIVLTVKIISLTIWFFLSHLGWQMWKKGIFLQFLGSTVETNYVHGMLYPLGIKVNQMIPSEMRSEAFPLKVVFYRFFFIIFSKIDFLGSFWVEWLENRFGTLSPHTIKDINECGNWLPFWIFRSPPLRHGRALRNAERGK